ncbi:MAG: cation-translocating P-type ATPase [Actinomycetota bacterium]
MPNRFDEGHHHHGHDDHGDGGLSLAPLEQTTLLLWAGGLLIVGFLLEGPGHAPQLAEIAFWVSLGCSVVTVVDDIVAQPLGVATLMAIGAVGAAALGAVHEGATLAILFAVAEAVIHRTLDHTRSGLRSLLELVPREVTVLRSGQEETLSPAQLAVGDLMVVKPGERIATDGVVVDGSSSLDCSALTGEPIPVEVQRGAAVHAAAVNGGGALTVEVTAPSAESSLARLVTVLTDAEANRGSAQAFVDRVAAVLIPLALVIAGGLAAFGLVTGEFSRWFYRALLVLVAMSPCAFVLAVPVTVLASIGAASRAGVLIKGGAVLEALTRLRVAAIDKTGTLTAAEPRVVETIAAPGVTPATVLAVAAALESRSEHPLAGAILSSAEGITFEPATEAQALPGQGLVGRVAGVPARLGKPGFIDAGPLEADVTALESQGSTVVLVERGEVLLGALAIRDELRPEAAEALAGLRAVGVDRVVMVTGDNPRTAELLGKQAGADEVRAELLPGAKVEAVRTLEPQGPVLMVGDGINDAPALAAAHVGVAMGAIGADLAVDVADVALMGDDLRRLPEVIAHARRAHRIVRQGMMLSSAIMAVLLPLAVTGSVRLAAAVLAHELAGVLIIVNGLRAGRRVELGRRPGDAPAVRGERHHRQPVLTPGRAAAALAALAVVVGVGGIVLHRAINRPNPYRPWAQAAMGVLERLDRVDTDSIVLPEQGAAATGVEFTIDCAGGQQAIRAVESEMPEAPDAQLKDLLSQLFAQKRRQYAACAAGDEATSAAAAREVSRLRADIRRYVARKLGQGHSH